VSYTINLFYHVIFLFILKLILFIYFGNYIFQHLFIVIFFVDFALFTVFGIFCLFYFYFIILHFLYLAVSFFLAQSLFN